MPGFHHPVFGPFGCDRQSIELAGKTNREIADVDHFLHFAETFGGYLADLDRNETAERRLGAAQFLAEQADQFAALGCRHKTPFEEGFMRRVDCLLRIRNSYFRQSADLGA
ncbi:hypothetical protein D3C73_705880 [compost metagenome]